MCGIAGFCIVDSDLPFVNTANMAWSLGLDMMSRGRDATGIATVSPKGKVKVRKKPWKADVFFARHFGIGTGAQIAMIHARATTQGATTNPDNNHPVQHGRIIGIHNGMIRNDYTLFREHGWERVAQVDTEAIFAALHHLPQGDALTAIDGSWAIAWLDLQEPRKLWLARGSTSPLHYACTKAGSIVFASTASAVVDAFAAGGISGKVHTESAPEGFLAYATPTEGFVKQEAFTPFEREYTGWSGHYDASEWPHARRTGVASVATRGVVIERGGGASKASESVVTTGRIDRPALPGSWPAHAKPLKCDDPFRPKVGDTRSVWHAEYGWVIEECIGVEKRKGTNDTEYDFPTWKASHFATTGDEIWPDGQEADASPHSDPPAGGGAGDDRALDDGVNDLTADEFDEMEYWRLNHASLGDLIVFEKELIEEDAAGYIPCHVIEVDTDGDRICIQSDPFWINRQNPWYEIWGSSITTTQDDLVLTTDEGG